MLAKAQSPWQGRAHKERTKKERASMAIYRLDADEPELPSDQRYWVAESASVIGRVRLKTDASVWFGSVLRGDNEWIEVGERSQIQDNSTLHVDPGFPIVIGADCVIGHNVMLHGCHVADNSLIGMGAIVLNGAQIGRCCLVGAGALVTEGKQFPDHSLIVGAPARVLRVLDAGEAQRIARAADGYVKRWQRYTAGLKRIG
jgi:carbonic anhydrase/acetyltransferase-like protein (isoleucine patch superfamily)